MSTKTTETTITPRKALAAASEVTSAAAAALSAAEYDIPRAQQALTDAEAKVVDLLAAAASGDTDASRSAIDKARKAIEEAKSDIEWSILKRQAAETAYHRANDDEVRAQRRVIADEYRAAYAEWNDPNNGEVTLLAQLTEVVTQLIPMIRARKQLQSRLAREIAHFPAEEKTALPARGSIGVPDYQYAAILVPVPVPEVAEAIKCGVGVAECDAKAKAQAAEQERLARAAGN